MAKICQNIVLENGGRGTFVSKNKKGEVMYRMLTGSKISEETFQLGNAWEFDATVDKTGNIHIVMTEEKGDMIYMRGSENRWIKGLVKQNLWAENIFTFPKDGGVMVFYGCENVLYCQKIAEEIQDPVMIDETLDNGMFFVVQKENGDFLVFYIDKEKRELGTRRFLNASQIWQGFEPITGDGEIEHVFATAYGDEVLVCYKAMGEVRFLQIGENVQQSLTRRHAGEAQCPVIITSRDGVKLCWIHNDKVFSSERKPDNSKWQRLEKNGTEALGQVEIFKFCGMNTVYKLGFLKNEHVGVWGEEQQTPQYQIVKKPDENRTNIREEERKIREEFISITKTEEMFEEIRAIHKKIEEMNGKIDKIKRFAIISSNKNAVQKLTKTNLAKINKK